MTRPSPRKVGKARVWKAWAYIGPSGDVVIWGGKVLAIGPSRRLLLASAGEVANEYGPIRVAPVEIREVLPRKAGARRGR